MSLDELYDNEQLKFEQQQLSYNHSFSPSLPQNQQPSQLPLGFKQQVSAAKLQSKLRGYLVRKRLDILSLSKCPLCSFRYHTQDQLKHHLEVNHQVEFNTLIKSIPKQRGVKKTPALNMPLKVKSPTKEPRIISNPKLQQNSNTRNSRPESASRRRTKSVQGQLLIEAAEAFQKSTPIKQASPSDSDRFGQSTQSILNLCEMIQEPVKKKSTQSSIQNLVKPPKLFRPAKLYEGLMFDFDLYVRAATMIQKAFRGFIVRIRNFGCKSLREYKKKLVICQRQVRKFNERKRQRYQQYSEYLVSKSKRIQQQLQDFQYIYSKFDKLRLGKQQNKWMDQAEFAMNNIKMSFQHLVVPEPQKKQKWVQTTTSRTPSPLRQNNSATELSNLNVEVQQLKQLLKEIVLRGEDKPNTQKTQSLLKQVKNQRQESNQTKLLQPSNSQSMEHKKLESLNSGMGLSLKAAKPLQNILGGGSLNSPQISSRSVAHKFSKKSIK